MLGDENTGNYLLPISTLSDDECSARKDQHVIVAGRNLAVQCIGFATEILSQLTATFSSLVCSLEARRAIVTYYRQITSSLISALKPSRDILTITPAVSQAKF